MFHIKDGAFNILGDDDVRYKSPKDENKKFITNYKKIGAVIGSFTALALIGTAIGLFAGGILFPGLAISMGGVLAFAATAIAVTALMGYCGCKIGKIKAENILREGEGCQKKSDDSKEIG
jgi:hypothetical protein